MVYNNEGEGIPGLTTQTGRSDADEEESGCKVSAVWRVVGKAEDSES